MTDAQGLRDLIQKALAHDPASVRALVDLLSPVIERRVAATLWRRGGQRNIRQDVKDMTQAVFLSLFEQDGKALRAWDPARGSPLSTFVALLAHRQVLSLLRVGRTTPWLDEPTDDEHLSRVAITTVVPEDIIGSREHLRILLDRIQEELSPLGLELFQRVILDEEPLEEVSAKMNKTMEALYKWRSRLLQRLRALSAEILADRVSKTRDEPRIVKEVIR